MRPYGYETDRRTIRKPEADVIRKFAEWLLADQSLRKATSRVNDEGHRTPGGNEFKPNVLRRIVLSDRVNGRPDPKTAILDQLTGKRLAALLTDEARNRGGQGSTRSYLLTGGLAVCGLCGTHLIARPNNTGRRGYVCASGAPSRGCGKIRVTADLFENEVVEQVLARLMMDNAKARIAKLIDKLQADVDGADDLILATKQRLADLGVMYADGKVSSDVLTAAQKRADETLSQLRKRRILADALQNVAALEADDLVTWWEGASLPQQRALLEVLVKRVTVFPVSVRGSKKWDPSRVKIEWAR